MGRIIVVEDNIIYSDFVCRLLESKGYPSVSTSTCNGARMLFAKMREDDIILADLRLNDGDGISLLEELRKQGKNNPYIVMTDYDEVPTAVRSMKQGAEDYIPKKLIEANLFPLLKTLRKRMERHDTPIHERQSTAFREIYRKIKLVAPTNMSVLILGESGTGKEHIAEKIHTMSKRSAGPFVAVDCGLLSKELASSTLFGHEKGAFTGAESKKQGFWEEAAGGTLFLDEIGNLPPEVQQMLLRALEAKRYRPTGGSKDKRADVRIIAACNADLPRYVEEGKFRTDLFYRLNTFPIHIPPLRERREDIPPLCRSLLDELSRKLKRRLELTPEAMDRLLAHNWPGNVRELRNVLEFCAYLTPSGVITELSLPENLRTGPTAQPSLTLAQRTRAFERAEILRLLERNGASLEGKKKTAAQLGISLASLYNKLNMRF